MAERPASHVVVPEKSRLDGKNAMIAMVLDPYFAPTVVEAAAGERPCGLTRAPLVL
jgi:hypothetical protein